MAAAAGSRAPVAGWTLIRLLGTGAQSEVWLARRGDEVAALKLQPLAAAADAEAAARRFLHAARLAQGLHHPAIVAVWDAGVEAGTGWLAMEPVPGSDLQRYTRAPRLLPLPVVLHLLRRVAEGLAHAHEHGVVHRDLKPANVLVNWADDAVRIADFGLARGAGAEDTATGIVPGTPAYSAPEQLAGAEPDARSDLYALGVMAFELLLGRRPHEAGSLGELLRRVAQEPVPPLAELQPGTPPALSDLVARLLARQPSARPVSAAAVAAELAAELAALKPGGRPSRWTAS